MLRIFELGVAEAAGERGGPGTVGRGDPRGREAAHTTSSGCTRVQQMPNFVRSVSCVPSTPKRAKCHVAGGPQALARAVTAFLGEPVGRRGARGVMSSGW